jgi:WhiB family transcriptional regulator, redox-sensing transcriptional regulator
MIATTHPDEYDRGGWRAHGACLAYPTAWWFSIRHDEIAAARRICAECPVRSECLDFAVARPALLGTWAATSLPERNAIRSVRRPCPT